ncbi:hypothetical protein QQX98_002049 [Neonectria punicea]|uniref:Uncharacterized protein n=1 Tax=Neonectria punicea TaxID=979145 RepID=A0ABR1HKQ3_9HYPO
MPHEQLGHWKEAGDVYMWLFQIAKTFPIQDSTGKKAMAVFMEYFRTITMTLNLRKAQQLGTEELESLESKIQKKLQD